MSFKILGQVGEFDRQEDDIHLVTLCVTGELHSSVEQSCSFGGCFAHALKAGPCVCASVVDGTTCRWIAALFWLSPYLLAWPSALPHPDPVQPPLRS